MPAYLTSIGTATPKHRIAQKDVLAFMTRAHQLTDEEAHQLQILYRASGISSRYSTISDYSRTADFDFFPNTKDLEPFPTTAQRATWYRQHALPLSLEAIRNCLQTTDPATITHLVTVSCTGMYAPGLDIDLVEQLGLSAATERTAINFMGCYAAFNALKVASHICRAQKAKVLVICTELCTLHFQKEKTDDNLLANALFGDGSAAVLVESEPRSTSLELSSFQSTLIPSARGDMAWAIGDFGFEMRLSAYVPDALQRGGQALLGELKAQDFDFYAVHPGGRRILDVIEQALGLRKEQNAASHDVLRQFGNMSSPTILFVLKQLLDGLKSTDDGKRLLALAFGPGLTIERLIANVHTS